MLWRGDLASHGLCQHHDIEPLPNGDVLIVAGNAFRARPRSRAGATRTSVRRSLARHGCCRSRPKGTDEFDVVWQWRAWDHVVQDLDPTKACYGDVTAFPGRIDVNGDHRSHAPMSEAARERFEEERARLEALGYVGGIGTSSDEAESEEDRERRRAWLDRSGDFLHTNGIDYLPSLDLIVLSSPELNELLVIDHSTTIEEARGERGGRHGKGGAILWRWGNPKKYGRGGDSDQDLFYQHDPKWLPPGPNGELRLTVFNNGGGRTERNWSSVEELVLPYVEGRGFVLEPDAPFGPFAPAWLYEDRGNFYSAFISGAERLPNGNTLICSGAGGRAFEVTPDGTTVWNWRCDLGGDVAPPDHAGNAPEQSMFRATRYAKDHPGVRVVLEASTK
ncbi:MAG: aryl-sulfate sulfotransferase [Planctomycetota bacterium]